MRRALYFLKIILVCLGMMVIHQGDIIAHHECVYDQNPNPACVGTACVHSPCTLFLEPPHCSAPSVTCSQVVTNGATDKHCQGEPIQVQCVEVSRRCGYVYSGSGTCSLIYEPGAPDGYLCGASCSCSTLTSYVYGTRCYYK